MALSFFAIWPSKWSKFSIFYFIDLLGMALDWCFSFSFFNSMHSLRKPIFRQVLQRFWIFVEKQWRRGQIIPVKTPLQACAPVVLSWRSDLRISHTGFTRFAPSLASGNSAQKMPREGQVPFIFEWTVHSVEALQQRKCITMRVRRL